MFAEELLSSSREVQELPMQIFDDKELKILRHARSTLFIRQQQPSYISRQTLEFSPLKRLDSLPLVQSQTSPPCSKTSARSKSHNGFSNSASRSTSRMETRFAKDTIPLDHGLCDPRPGSNNTPRPSTPNSTLERAKDP
jgi:hypothetical protein